MLLTFVFGHDCCKLSFVRATWFPWLCSGGYLDLVLCEDLVVVSLAISTEFSTIIHRNGSRWTHTSRASRLSRVDNRGSNALKNRMLLLRPFLFFAVS